MNKLISLIVTTTALAAISADTLAQESDVPPYEMTVLLDQAQGNAIASGSFERAIRKLSGSAKTANQHVTLTNLCVAYAKTKQVDSALQACDAAIDLLKAKQADQYFGHPRKASRERVLQSDLSIVLSNRGVLFAVTGDYERARESFEAAIELPANRSKAGQNMQRLTASES